jgi:hypothetical protein
VLVSASRRNSLSSCVIGDAIVDLNNFAIAECNRQHARGVRSPELFHDHAGMIESIKKVQHVFDQLLSSGIGKDRFSCVYAPMGFDIGADSPPEIAVSVVAELLSVLRARRGRHLRSGDSR